MTKKKQLCYFCPKNVNHLLYYRIIKNKQQTLDVFEKRLIIREAFTGIFCFHLRNVGTIFDQPRITFM